MAKDVRVHVTYVLHYTYLFRQDTRNELDVSILSAYLNIRWVINYGLKNLFSIQ